MVGTIFAQPGATSVRAQHAQWSPPWRQSARPSPYTCQIRRQALSNNPERLNKKIRRPGCRAGRKRIPVPFGTPGKVAAQVGCGVIAYAGAMLPHAFRDRIGAGKVLSAAVPPGLARARYDDLAPRGMGTIVYGPPGRWPHVFSLLPRARRPSLSAGMTRVAQPFGRRAGALGNGLGGCYLKWAPSSWLSAASVRVRITPISSAVSVASVGRTTNRRVSDRCPSGTQDPRYSST